MPVIRRWNAKLASRGDAAAAAPKDQRLDLPTSIGATYGCVALNAFDMWVLGGQVTPMNSIIGNVLSCSRMSLTVTQWFWKHEFWLPPGFTWEDMKETDEIRYPQPQHLLLGIPFAFLLIGLRLAFERNVALPLSRKMGLREKVRRKPSPNAVLEAFYNSHQKRPEERELSGLAKQCDLQPRQVERWFRSRLNQDRPSLTKKFCEACWRTSFYITSFTTGLAVLHDKSWFWDHRECWTGYPQQPLLPSIFAYYMLQLSFYCSLVITLPFDVKRKDFKEQIVHHAATIFLISFSYCANYLRIGTLVMIIHDASDCFLEPTKIFNYLKWRRICDTLFITFTIVFLVTRLVIFPYKVLYNTAYYSMELYQPFFGYYFVNALLIVLQLLHIFWSYLIIHMVYKFLASGTMEKDLRSNSEDSEKGEEEKEAKKNGPAPPSLNSGGDCISKETPLQLNGSSHPANGNTKISDLSSPQEPTTEGNRDAPPTGREDRGMRAVAPPTSPNEGRQENPESAGTGAGRRAGKTPPPHEPGGQLASAPPPS
uniref:ceramide synthase 4-like n=1 Tax=Euleptes europaea TaxID=460621 RepID=UPI00254029A6|nr:ceramide synthase 4-like [Euleptes europaea]